MVGLLIYYQMNGLMFTTPLDSIPKFHHYFSESNETQAIIVNELLGETLSTLLKKHDSFSTATIMRIGLQMVSLKFYNRISVQPNFEIVL